MVIDSSVLIAILVGEPEAEVFAQIIANASKKMASSFSLLESAIAIEARKGALGGQGLDLLIHRAKIEIVPLIPEHIELARYAWRKYGKGRHAAGLNIGDCCSYALTVYSGESLLYKGGDFSQTDVKPVPWSV
ncbi:MAG: type II toxin-antitoxin system VapC family toxin [Planctomycetes bacterium]|nr:type II toxin-antitoxin system VapC family toxin [Planctomycetota bacterium]